MTNVEEKRLNLIADAHQFYQLGWMVGTAGNLSAKLSDGSFWITASGKSKGKLQVEDFLRIAPDGTILEAPRPENRPSAETSIHQAIYARFPEARACYHVHSVEANLASRLVEGDYLPLPPLEMLKGLGVWEEKPAIGMIILENYLEVSRIAAMICDRFSENPPAIPALLIRDHGVTVWADSCEKARNQVEIVEYLLRYLVNARRL